MLKRVEEDWSFFNQAVREKAEGQSRPEAPPLKLVTPKPPPAPNKPAPPMSPAPPFQPPVTTATPSSPLRPQPLNGGWVFASVIKLLLGVLAIILLIALLEAGSRNALLSNPAITGTGPGAVANGTVGTGGIENVVTDYTTFHTVMYRSWKVVTGWKFANNHAAQPDRQYCYLEVLTTGGQQSYDIEERAPVRRHDMPKVLIPGLGKATWDEAATKCVWQR